MSLDPPALIHLQPEPGGQRSSFLDVVVFLPPKPELRRNWRPSFASPITEKLSAPILEMEDLTADKKMFGWRDGFRSNDKKTEQRFSDSSRT